MFFKKKKPKLDARVRFQHKQFTTKLGSARTYRRTSRPVPESKLNKYLEKIGLGSKWVQIIVGLIVLTVLYLIYFPNFLSLKNIEISGLSQSQTRDLEIAIRDQIASAKFYNPQSNLVFLDKDLIEMASKKTTSINSIISVKKNFKAHSLQIVAESKYEKYLVATPEKVFDIYNDGTFKAVSGIKNNEEWLYLENPNMIKVRLYQNTDEQNNQQYFDPNLKTSIDSLNDKLRALDTLKLAYFSFKEPQTQAASLVNDIEVEKTQNDSLENTTDQKDLSEQNEQKNNTTNENEALNNKKSEEIKIKLPITSSEIHVVFYKTQDRKKTFRVIFDSTNKNLEKSVESLKLLLSQTSPERFNQLYYIDMRIEDKAFICLINTACVK